MFILTKSTLNSQLSWVLQCCLHYLVMDPDPDPEILSVLLEILLKFDLCYVKFTAEFISGKRKAV